MRRSALAEAEVTAAVLGYIDAAGAEQRVDIANAAVLPLETCRSVRAFPSYRGQLKNPGLWWSSTNSRHVAYGSWADRDQVMLLDYDPKVVAFASRPFQLLWTQHDDRDRSHTPGWFARLADGGRAVIDRRPGGVIKPADQVAFEATAHACGLVGWQYRLVDAPDQVFVINLKWLAGYRQPRNDVPRIATQLIEVFAEPRALMAGTVEVGDPIAVLPTLFHLLWRRRLTADLSVLLHAGSLVQPGPEV